MLAITLACGLLVWFAPSVRSSSAQDDRTTLLVAQDADGDGIGDTVDPDDDNDGILDTDEGNPVPSEPSGSGGNGSGPPDADGDGIGDALDPDDNNNGVTDNEEPPSESPSQPSAPSAPSPPSSSSGGSESGSASSGSDSEHILALPVTGSGPALQVLPGDAAQEAWIRALLAVCLMTAILSLDVIRQRRCTRPYTPIAWRRTENR
jgi:hypothetical protein